MTKTVKIPGELESVALDHKVADASQIKDSSKNNKSQEQINTETYTYLENINEALASLSPEQQEAIGVASKANSNEARIGYYTCNTSASTAAKSFSAIGYILSIGGSMKVKMTNDNTADNATLNINSTGAKPLYYAGERASASNTWEAGETVEVYYDGTSYYANNVAGGSGSGDGAFDVSDKYPTSGVDGGNTYTLQGALAVLSANLPASKKKGGMSIKFIQSSDNKYVQFRLIATSFSTTESDWQGVIYNIIPHSVNIPTGDAVLQAKSPLFCMSFVGKNNAISYGEENHNFQKGRKYRVYVNPNVDMSGVTLHDSSSRFGIILYNVGVQQSTGLISIPVSQPLSSFYDITIPTTYDIDYIKIEGRCTEGVVFTAYFDDLTNIEPLQGAIENIEESINVVDNTINGINANLKSLKNYTEGYYFDNTGSTVEDEDYIINSDFIPVTPGSTILWKSNVANSAAKLIIYNSNKEKINYYSSYNSTDNECLLDATAAYVKASFYKSGDRYIKYKTSGVVLYVPKYGAEYLQEEVEELDGRLTVVENTVDDIDDSLKSVSNFEAGKYYTWSNGAPVEVAEPNSCISELIKVTPGSTIVWKSGVANSNYNLIGYAEDGVTVITNYRSYTSPQEVILDGIIHFIRASFYGFEGGYIKLKSDNTILYEQNHGISVLKEEIDALDERVENNESAIETLLSDSPVTLNSDMEVSVQAAAARPEAKYYADVATQYKNNRLLPVLAVITDSHCAVNDLTDIERAFAYADNYDEIVATLALGDIADNGTICKNTNWNTLENKYDKPILIIPGNHEAYMGWNYTPATNALEADLMSKWYNETLRTRNGETHAEVDNVLKSYWYRDFSVTDAYDNVTRTLRVIGLNCYSVSEDNFENPLGFSPEQLNWLINLLENCASNTHVVIINHEAISTQLKEKRYTDVFNMPSYSSYSQASRSHNVIAQIVNAWKHREQLSITYKENSYSHDFTNAGGNFVCYITGHQHVDGVYKHQDYADQVEVNLICTASGEKFQEGDLPRLIGTRSRDCFTLFSYDWYNNRINLVRIGSNVTTAMKERKYDNIEIPIEI